MAVNFAIEIVKYLLGQEKADELKKVYYTQTKIKVVAIIKFHKDIFYGIKDEKIIQVMSLYPGSFCSRQIKDSAYLDNALPIGLARPYPSHH